jgi:hypothetical protein
MLFKVVFDAIRQFFRGRLQIRGLLRAQSRLETPLRRYLRVITQADRVTILNAFPDRGFKP